MIKVLTIVGTRPEAIKLAPVIKTLEHHPERCVPVVCATAQHRDMLDQVLRVFQITPQYDLNIMRPGQSVTELTGDILQGIGKLLSHERPDLVLVQGDTTTTFAVSLAAFYHKIRVGHVEAGLRTFEKYQPFPEEMNRQLTAVLADDHFAPTTRAKENLLQEGVPEAAIVVTGNTGIDALYSVLARLKEQPTKVRRLARLNPKLHGKRLLLVTAHRREHFGVVFEQICEAILEIVDEHPDVLVIFPVHPNPNIKQVANRLLNNHEQIELIEPLAYTEFVALLDRAFLVLTDSGGIQEEAPSLGKPVLVMRDVTERTEAIEAGTARLVGTKKMTIVDEARKLLNVPTEYEKASRITNPFGDGKASERVVEHIFKCFS